MSYGMLDLFRAPTRGRPFPRSVVPFVIGGQIIWCYVWLQWGMQYLLLSVINLTSPVVWIVNSMTAGTGGSITNMMAVASTLPPISPSATWFNKPLAEVFKWSSMRALREHASFVF